MLKNIFIGVIMAVGLLSAGCGGHRQGPVYTTIEGSVWHTTMRITYSDERNLEDSVVAVASRVEASLSPFMAESRISLINRNENMTADGYIATVLAESQRVNRLSGGAFDPTVAPLVNLWGFGYEKGVDEPSQAEIDSCLQLVGIGECRIDAGHMVKKSVGTQFNFSAITKGFGIDRIADMLRGEGVDNYMVEIGGEIALRGVNARGEMWHIQIDAPSSGAAGHERLWVIALTDCCVATSGNYRNYRDTEHGRVGHTISPLTGLPVMGEVVSATVIAPTTMTADALATSLMAMDAASGMAMIEGEPGVEALLVVDDGAIGRVLTSSGFPERIDAN